MATRPRQPDHHAARRALGLNLLRMGLLVLIAGLALSLVTHLTAARLAASVGGAAAAIGLGLVLTSRTRGTQR